jgi:hypothetical protein
VAYHHERTRAQHRLAARLYLCLSYLREDLDADIHTEVLGSDRCPVSLTLALP